MGASGRSTDPLRLLSIVGTRPEAIKIAPIAIEARRRPALRHAILATGQHDALFDEALAGFGLAADHRLPALSRDPDPDVMLERLADAIEPALARLSPDLVLVQGDTTSAYAGAIAADRLAIPIGHVEAGLRSGDLANPWPEERNRVRIDRLASLLFAPTRRAAANLLEDPLVAGVPVVTGNTGIDALLTMRRRLPAPPPRLADAPALIFLTCHRRESFGEGVRAICRAALHLADRGDVRILCPVHTNPAAGDVIRAMLSGHRAITLTQSLPYRETVAAMASATLILTDSGGIQEEAPALGVPTLVLRDVTERPEALATGNLELVGADPDRIVSAASRLLDDPVAYAAMTRPAFPFGEGDAAVKILDGIEQYFSRAASHEHPLPLQTVWTKDDARQGA
ncbi:MAG TPA: UDP-N-acetylglucosamine 2-epimerase (non-hydrolyzing) [Sphingomonas sp.]|nr:UDP-N-acetylglucosamine 2-epimerase (non-hydrolyzing) [Sphingomonas sp.]